MSGECREPIITHFLVSVSFVEFLAVEDIKCLA